ncbi:one cut domain family member 3 isoform X2 [Anopheles bellator]|uniref:one cut domain family member 3 isoform X2 n=1 Tax=Anopheles bellator TaxID=139047 RepID=UPI00264997AB|nr:one cut domain family member 3 isoform X2 [Anopheles bellator]
MRAFISLGLLIFVLAQCALAVPLPQFLTFRDGKFGVNFGGYHAEAGLGGFLTGNSAHGGLSASAGTPHGQQAGAGLGGIVGGNARTAGGAYAGATAGSGVGASAAIGGGLDGAGGAGGVGAESHAGGLSTKVVKLGQTNAGAPPTEVVISKQHGHEATFTRIDNHDYSKELHTELVAPAPHPAPEQSFTKTKTFYKKKVIGHPHKVAVVQTSSFDGGPSPGLDISRFFDFQAFSNLGAQYAHPPPPPPPPPAPIVHHHKTIVKESSFQPTFQKEIHTRLESSNGHSAGGSSSTHVVASSTHNSNFWNDIFNIPISTLSAVNQFLNNKSGSGSVHVEKRVEVH